MNSAELIGVMRNVAPILREYVVSALAPFQQKLADLEARPPIKGDKGEDADPELIKLAVLEAVERLPKPIDGKDADPATIAKMIADAIAGLPKPQDGKSITLEDVSPIIEAALAAADERQRSVRESVPDDIAALVAKAAALMAEPMPTPQQIQSQPVVLAFPAQHPQQRRTTRKTIVSRRNDKGEIVSEVTEQEVA